MKSRIAVLMGGLCLMVSFAWPSPTAAASYRNFRVAIYVTRDTVNSWADLKNLATAFDNMQRQVKFDKVYLEIASGKSKVHEDTLDGIKQFFVDHGIEVSAATATNGGGGYNGASAQGGSLVFSAPPADRDYLKSVAEMAARHFDEIILDDWYFSASKTAADIAAKGDKSWTQYRMDALDEAASSLLIKPAKAINPKMRLIIKYPNWYAHYQGLGYDLEVEPKIFDAIYTGVETRDPDSWEQHLQQYESYDIMRYLENVKPGGNGGGWVDTLFTQYIDRYPEQIIDTALSKPKEITLWQWNDALRQINVGTRPWQDQASSFNYGKMVATYPVPGSGGTSLPTTETQASNAASQPDATLQPEGRNRVNRGPIYDARNGRIAGYALDQADSFLDKLGNPIGIAAYRPPHAIGEEYYYEFLGMVGFPIDLHPEFPDHTNSPVILLTESAKSDPDLVNKIKAQLSAGKNVTITSGLLRALQGKGIEDISEFECTDLKVAVTDFSVRSGRALPDAKLDSPILFPIIHLLTNQSWGQVNGFDDKSPENAYPLVLRDSYDHGIFNVLVLPDNIADLYRLPKSALNAIRNEIMGSFPIHLTDAPAQVSLFAYDNDAFVVESFLPTETTVTVAVGSNPKQITDVITQQTFSPLPAPATRRRPGDGGGRRDDVTRGARFTITVPAHSYRVFTSEK